jgi:hypothetical protein
MKEKDSVERLHFAASKLLSCLERILADLPRKRDWLDPALEAEAREAIEDLRSKVDPRIDPRVVSKSIFVFGSNLRGVHGKGAALCARQYHGAVYGQGVGVQGSSYAIPTKDGALRPLPISAIKPYVDEFKEFAASRPDLAFQVTAIGCGLAGYKPEDIAPLFRGSPRNCVFPSEFIPLLVEVGNG